MSILHFSKHFQLIFDNSNVNKWQTDKTKNGKLFFCKLFRIIQFSFLILLREATLESKVVPTSCNSSALMLHTCMSFSKVELFSIFSQTFLELIFATKKQCYWDNQLFYIAAVKKILPILCVWTLEILFANKRILTE